MVIKIQLLKDGHNGKKSFNNFIRATNITHNARKQALLIHSIAQDTEKKIESLNPGEEPTFECRINTDDNIRDHQMISSCPSKVTKPITHRKYSPTESNTINCKCNEKCYNFTK